MNTFKPMVTDHAGLNRKKRPIVVMRNRYKHDCTECIFIAPVFVLNKVVDIYRACGDDNFFIVRYSSDGPDYQTVHLTSINAPELITDSKGEYALNINYEMCDLVQRIANELEVDGVPTIVDITKEGGD